MPMPRLLAALIAVVLLSLSVAAQAPIFRMNTSAGAYPNAGWSTVTAANNRHNRTHMGAVGPNGQGVIELAQISARSVMPFYGGQFGWGWSGPMEATDPPAGAVRYYRWIFRFSPDTNFLGIDWSDGSNADYLSNKMLIVGDGGDGNRQRIIVESLEASPRVAGRFALRLAIDGGETSVRTTNLVAGTWYYVQLEARSSSPATATNGRYSLWVNSNAQASPTITNGNFVLRTQQWGRSVRLGAFVNFGMQPTGVHKLQIAAFEASTTFDPIWYTAGLPSTQPQPPTAVRLLARR